MNWLIAFPIYWRAFLATPVRISQRHERRAVPSPFGSREGEALIVDGHVTGEASSHGSRIFLVCRVGEFAMLDTRDVAALGIGPLAKPVLRATFRRFTAQTQQVRERGGSGQFR